MLHPVVVQIMRAAHFQRDDAPDARLRKLDALLALSDASPEDRAVMADLLGLPVDEAAGLDRLTPLRRKERPD